MNIHPLWFVCILVRIALIFLLRMRVNSKIISYIIAGVLFAMGAGFIYKGIFGSNNETQITKVFWHETRFVHGALYLLASYYYFNNNIEMSSLVLVTDIIFSIMYRLYMNK